MGAGEHIESEIALKPEGTRHTANAVLKQAGPQSTSICATAPFRSLSKSYLRGNFLTSHCRNRLFLLALPTGFEPVLQP
jgi:hypothetical protein